MKKAIISTALAVSCLLPVQAFASGTSTLNAKYSPDGFWYPFHTFMENARLTFASSGASKASLLQQDANERLAEAQQMLSEKKPDLAEKALKQYNELLTRFQAQFNQAVTNGQDVSSIIKDGDSTQSAVDSATQALSTLSTADSQQILSEAETAQSDVQDLTDSQKLLNPELGQVSTDSKNPVHQQKEQLLEQQLISQIGNDSYTQAKNDGLNARQIMAIQSLAQQSGKTFSDVLTLFDQNNKGIGATAKSLNLQPKDVLKSLNNEFHQLQQGVHTAFQQERQQRATERKDQNQQARQDAVNQAFASQVSSDNVAQAKADGLNDRQILAVQAMANQTGKSFSEVLALFNQNGKEIGATAKALNVKPQDVLKSIQGEASQVRQEVKTTVQQEREQRKANPNPTNTNGNATTQSTAITPRQEVRQEVKQQVKQEVQQAVQQHQEEKQNNGKGKENK